MDVQIIANYLRDKITWKETELERLHPNVPHRTMYMGEGEYATHQVTIEFLKTHIAELKVILQAVEELGFTIESKE